MSSQTIEREQKDIDGNVPRIVRRLNFVVQISDVSERLCLVRLETEGVARRSRKVLVERPASLEHVRVDDRDACRRVEGTEFVSTLRSEAVEAEVVPMKSSSPLRDRTIRAL
jgi:hypothetical protein